MIKSLTHEFYKFRHQSLLRLGFLILMCLMIYTLIPMDNVDKSILSQGFGASQWIIIIMIAISSDFITMEFRNNTIDTLIYKTPHKFSVYFSKMIVLFLYSFSLILFSFLFTMILKFLLIHKQIGWFEDLHGNTVILSLTLNLVGTIFYLMFIIALSLLLISVFKTNTAVISIGLAIGFLGANISSLLMKMMPGIKYILAWNPLNMINVIIQLPNKSVMEFSNLTNAQLILGNIIYTMIFLVIGYIAFKKRQL